MELSASGLAVSRARFAKARDSFHAICTRVNDEIVSRDLNRLLDELLLWLDPTLAR